MGRSARAAGRNSWHRMKPKQDANRSWIRGCNRKQDVYIHICVMWIYYVILYQIILYYIILYYIIFIDAARIPQQPKWPQTWDCPVFWWQTSGTWRFTHRHVDQNNRTTSYPWDIFLILRKYNSVTCLFWKQHGRFC